MIDNFESMLDDIRIKINEQTKDLTNKAAADIINANVKRLAEQYGIKLVKAAPVRLSPPKE